MTFPPYDRVLPMCVEGRESLPHLSFLFFRIEQKQASRLAYLSSSIYIYLIYHLTTHFELIVTNDNEKQHIYIIE